MTTRIHCKGQCQRRKRLAKLQRDRQLRLERLWADARRVFLGIVR